MDHKDPATISLPEQVNPRTFYIQTFGCQMNVADTERMEALLADAGLFPSKSADAADVILVNGCSVRDKAVHKAVSALGRFQSLKKTKKSGEAMRGPVIGLGGCVGQLEKQELFKRAPYVDFVFGPDAIEQLPEIMYRVVNGERHRAYVEFDPALSYSTRTRLMKPKAQAFVNIMKGCDKYCTYCIVPFTRGREKSRTIDEVVDDIAALVAQGVREVTLLGQNVNSFGKGNPNRAGREPLELHNVIGKVGPRAGDENFPQLLRAIDTDPRCAALKRIRFTSSHPLDFSDELIGCYAPAAQGGVSRLAKHLHLPVQSGSNAVLQRMGRHHRIEGYIEQMESLRALCPDIGLSTDLIVGFPGETDAEFKETLKLLDLLQYDSIYAFAYSPRPGTRAAKLADDVPGDVKNERLNRVLQHQIRIAEARYASRIGKVMEVLVEGEAKRQSTRSGQMPGLANGRVWTARTTCNRIVNFSWPAPRDLTGQFMDVRIESATGLALYGAALEKDTA